MRLDGETALITGASRGIGESIAHVFARNGANLVLMARRPHDVERVAAQVAEHGAKSVAFPGDFSNRSDVRAMADAALKKFGRIDVLINAAGIYGPLAPPAEDHLDERAAMIETNLMGAVFAVHAVLPHMLARRKGAIINFCGAGAVQPFPRFSICGTSKSALARFTQTSAEGVREFGIRINAIAPAVWDTHTPDPVLEFASRGDLAFCAPLSEQKADCEAPPERAADLALFLASDLGEGITGRLISAILDDWKSFPESIDPGHAASITPP